eukprot:TRINITY_DN4572_c0_g1_i2.p1 TRINITY_DN4572_c0_g1~~TRINITY_DN4572_c0_g1_i2.p1  ORF type:complete len:320 (+),score=37.49 TRINITY_DN4572_c0_g1_i2:66-962(+)
MELQSAPEQQALISGREQNTNGRVDDSEQGATVQNMQSRLFGECYGITCMCCAACGCAQNLVTVPQGCVGVVTQFGRYSRTLPAGRHAFNIMSEKVRQVDMRTVCLEVPPQSVMSRDNLKLGIDAVCFYRVFDAEKAVFTVQNYSESLSNLAQVTMRTVLGEMTLSEILNGRQTINSKLKQLLDDATNPWGIRIDTVELKDLKIDEKMQRALAAKAEALQEADAKLVQANAQRDAAKVLSEAAKHMNSDPNAIKLQWFETLRIISTQGKNTTVIVPDGMSSSAALGAMAAPGVASSSR